MSKNKLKGGLSDKMTKKDIVKKFKVTLQKIERELRLGTKIEMEHSKSKEIAKEIAMDHLAEIPDYYTRLNKMEVEAKKKWDVKESTVINIKRLLREHVNIEVTDETPDVSTYRIIYNDREVGLFGITNTKNMDLTKELVFIKLRPDHNYKSMEIISETIIAMWETFTDTQKILVTPRPESRTFWHKMGANRLNDEYLMLLRGH